MTSLDTQVIVVGAGPAGLMLAGELRLGGADVIVLEQRELPTTESRASTVHARTMELLDNRGLLDDLPIPPNQPRGHFGGIPLDLRLPSPYPGQWKIPQQRIEELFTRRALDLGADLRRRWRVTGLTDHGDHVEVTADTPDGTRRLRASYLVGCDGEDSTVRELTGADFPGRAATRELLRADVAGIEIPNRRFERLETGLAIAARNPEGVTRVMVHEYGTRAPAGAAGPTFADLVAAWKRVTGEDISGGAPLWVNAFGDANRQLASYRHGRVLFAGDAAHQQMPIGGQAMNLGIQDAMNLGWKLARHLGPLPPDGLLDTYHCERHAVGADVLANIAAQALLLLGDAEVEPMRTLLASLMAEEPNRVRLAAMVSGLDIRYDVGEQHEPAHPLLGTRLPDAVLTVDGTPTRSAALLRTGRGVLLDFSAEQVHQGCGRWADRVTTVAADPVSDGPLHGVDGALVRPDGYLAWIGSSRPDAVAALERWFGPPLSRKT